MGERVAGIQAYLNRYWKLGGVCIGVLIAVVMIWTILPQTEQISYQISGDTFYRIIIIAQEKNAFSLNLWYKGHIAIQIITIIAALVAVFLTALSNSGELKISKKYTLFASLLTASLTSLHPVLHARDNIETFIRAGADLTRLEVEYLAGRSKICQAPVRCPRLENDEVPHALLQLQLKLIEKFSEIISDQQRAYANIGSHIRHSTSESQIRDPAIQR